MKTQIHLSPQPKLLFLVKTLSTGLILVEKYFLIFEINFLVIKIDF